MVNSNLNSLSRFNSGGKISRKKPVDEATQESKGKPDSKEEEEESGQGGGQSGGDGRHPDNPIYDTQIKLNIGIINPDHYLTNVSLSEFDMTSFRVFFEPLADPILKGLVAHRVVGKDSLVYHFPSVEDMKL